MRQTNPWERFFTKDVIPSEGEVGNAFWGYHVGNNIARLMNVDGTVVFPAVEIPNPKSTDLVREAWIPTTQLGFNAAPAIQFAVYYQEQRTLTRTIGEKTPIFGVTSTLLTDYDNPNIEEGDPYTYCTVDTTMDKLPWYYDEDAAIYRIDWVGVTEKFWGMLGEDDEIMNFQVFEIVLHPEETGWPTKYADLSTTKLQVVFYIIRSQYGTDLEEHEAGLQIYQIDPNEITESVNITGGQYLLNPPWVQGVLDANKLTIKWMSKEQGTVYFKIFGV